MHATRAFLRFFDRIRHFAHRLFMYNENMNLRASISSYLLSLGIKPSSKGYRYLAELIYANLSGMEILPLKYVGYRLISEKFHASNDCVDKNIQNCISKAWLDGDLDALYGEFGNTIDIDKGKPTAKQFIMQACEKLRNMCV